MLLCLFLTFHPSSFTPYFSLPPAQEEIWWQLQRSRDERREGKQPKAPRVTQEQGWLFHPHCCSPAGKTK